MEVLSRITNFRQGASDQDRIILVFAAEDTLTDEQRRAMEDIKAMGRSRIGSTFDVEAVSLETIFQRLQDESSGAKSKLRVHLKSNLVESGQNLFVGSTPLIELFDFLKLYKKTTQDLDQLYERTGTTGITKALVALFNDESGEAVKALLQNGIELIDDYLTQGTDDSVHNEPRFINDFNGDLNAFIKWEGLGKNEDSSPRYRSLIADYRKLMGKAKAGQTTDRDLITAVIKGVAA